MEEKVLSLPKHCVKFLNELTRKKFEDDLKELENDPAVINFEEWHERITNIPETSINPAVITMMLPLMGFHKQLEIHKQILRDCMNIDWEKETAGLEMESMRRRLEKSRKKLYSYTDQLRNLPVLPFLLL